MAKEPPAKLRLLFVVESGTDVRMVNGLAEQFDLTIAVRALPTGREVNYPSHFSVSVRRGPNSRVGFATWLMHYLATHTREHDTILVQGYGLAALACNFVSRINKQPVFMLICSPIEAYYRCLLAREGKQRSVALVVLHALAWLNARLGYGYVVLSEYLGNVVRSHGTKRPIYNIPVYGVDTQVFCPLPYGAHKERCKAKLGLPTSGSLLFFSSRIAPEKDAATLLAAFRKLLDCGEDLWLLHRSGGYQQFQREAEKFGVAMRVVATDAKYPGSELAADYQACDLCVQASWEEGLGFSALEALACGTPVVATAVGGLRETIRPCETGWTYIPGDVDALAACILDSLHDIASATQRTQAGRCMVQTTYAAPIVFSRLAQLLNGTKEYYGTH